MITIKTKNGDYKTVCSCGQELPFKATIIMHPEKRECPVCGRTYYIENPAVDWETALCSRAQKS